MKPAIKLLPLLFVGACATVPTGPSTMALPGSGKSFDQFRFDDAECRHFALESIGGTTAERAQQDSAVRSAVVGTLIGAAAGAAIGGHRGAGVGAGTGLLVGSAAGAGAADTSAYGAQRRYDQGYLQCMYAKGHRVPVYGRYSDSRMYAPPPPPPPPAPSSSVSPAPPTYYPPPPPPGR